MIGQTISYSKTLEKIGEGERDGYNKIGIPNVLY